MSIQESIKKELTFKTSRSSGPGGQHVNKTSSRVEVIFDLTATTLFTEDEKLFMTQKLDNQLDSKGCIHVVSQANRSQLRNKTEAITRLTTLLLNALIKPKKRKPTKPSKGMIERRLKQKKVRSDIKKSRGNWGSE